MRRLPLQITGALDVSNDAAFAAALDTHDKLDLTASVGPTVLWRAGLALSLTDTRRALAQALKQAAADARDPDLFCYEEGCFLTTAACNVVGLPDDCFELQSLRRYRDDVLERVDGGRAIILRYYDVAPKIVAAINRRPDAQKIWVMTYVLGIVPSAIAARAGANRLALAIYKAMLMRLVAVAGLGA